MKNTKKFASIATAALLAACTVVPSMASMPVWAASGDNSITINTDDNEMTHGAMAAYQVFAGTYNDTDTNLTVTGWGDGINVTAFITAIKADSTFVTDGSNVFESVAAESTATTAQQVSDIVGSWTSDSAEAKAFAKLAVANKTTASGTYNSEQNQITNLADGYYVIADTEAATDDDPIGSAFTLGLLQVAGGADISVTPKIDYPTVVKKVQEDDVDTDGGYGTGYNDVADWDVNTDVPFKIIANMPSNIAEYDHYYLKFTDTLDDSFSTPESIVVTVDETTIDLTDDYTVSKTGNDMTIEIMDLKGIEGLTINADTKVTVTYTAKLNVTGTSAVIGLNGQENKVKLEYSNNPNVTGDGTEAPDNTGTTPEDKVIVFTYELDITKIDGATEAAVEGAQFKLSNGNGVGQQWATVDENGYFTGWVGSEEGATVLESDASGIFKIIGLDDGTYYLYEQNWSEEYNIPETPFTVVIDATTSFTQDSYTAASNALTAFTGSVGGVTDDNASVNNGIVSGTIENNKGSTLPSTGGIGTTIFYIGGGVLVVGAGVLLIAKKRAKEATEA